VSPATRGAVCEGTDGVGLYLFCTWTPACIPEFGDSNRPTPAASTNSSEFIEGIRSPTRIAPVTSTPSAVSSEDADLPI
jgi:hypothetical protein